MDLGAHLGALGGIFWELFWLLSGAWSDFDSPFLTSPSKARFWWPRGTLLDAKIMEKGCACKRRDMANIVNIDVS